jgi:hypothetical protein
LALKRKQRPSSSRALPDGAPDWAISMQNNLEAALVDRIVDVEDALDIQKQRITTVEDN